MLPPSAKYIHAAISPPLILSLYHSLCVCPLCRQRMISIVDTWFDLCTITQSFIGLSVDQCSSGEYSTVTKHPSMIALSQLVRDVAVVVGGATSAIAAGSRWEEVDVMLVMQEALPRCLLVRTVPLDERVGTGL